MERTYIREMLSRLSDKKIIKKAVASSATPSVGNVSLIGRSEIDLSKVQLNGQAVNLSTDAMQTIQATPGTATANKAIVVNSSKNIEQLQDVSVNELYVNGEMVTGIINTGATVSDSSYMNNIQPGVSAPGKIMSLDSDKNTSTDLLSSKNLILNGGSLSTNFAQSINAASKYNSMSLDSFVNVYIPLLADSCYSNNGGYMTPQYYAKVGKIFIIHYTNYSGSNVANNHTTICQNIYAASGGAWTFTLTGVTTELKQDKCWYDSTTDRHYIPYTTFVSGTTYNLCVYISPTGDPSTWTAGQWTSYTICSASSTSSALAYSSGWNSHLIPGIRWSSLLSKFVIMGFTPATNYAYLCSLYTSTDGTSWTRLSTIPVTSIYTQMVVTSSAIYVFTSTTTMYYTTNGTTWNSKTLASILVNSQGINSTYLETLDMVIVGQKKRLASTIIGMSAGAEFNQIDTQLTDAYTYYSPLNIYFTSLISGDPNYIYVPSTNTYIPYIGCFVGGYSVFPCFSGYGNFLKSLRFNVNLQPAPSETMNIIDPSTYLNFECKTKSLISDFAWAPAINKYIVLGIINDGFNTTYDTRTAIYHSDDLETFTFISYPYVTTAAEMCYNPDTNALFIFTRASNYVYTSTDYGLTFGSTNLGVINGMYYIPLLKSVICVNGGNSCIINHGNNYNFTTDVIYITSSASAMPVFYPGTMNYNINRQSSGYFASTNLLAILSAIMSTPAAGTRSGFFGSYYLQSIDNTQAQVPRTSQLVNINKYSCYPLSFESTSGSITSGVQMSNIEYIDHMGLYVALTPGSNYMSSGRFVYSYNKTNWFEPVMNQLSMNVYNTSFYSLRYDQRSGYLYVMGTNGFFKSINSFKSLSIETIPSILSNYTGPVAHSNYRDKLWPFASLTSIVLNDLDYCRGTYVACKTDVIMYGQKPHLMTNVSLTGNWLALAASKDKFVIVANDKLAYSSTGASWTNVSVSGLSSISWSPMDSKFGAVGTDLIAFSSDGITWSTFNVTGNWKSIKYNNGYWLAVGLNKIAYTSTASSPTVITLTGDWKDSSFGGQWVIVGANACAFSTKVNDITSWSITPTSSSFSNVHYNEDLRAFFMSGINYAMYMQRTNTFVNYSYATEATKCKWFYRLQCFVMVTNQGLITSKIIGSGLDSSLCHSDTNNIVTRTSGVLDSSFNISDNAGVLSGNQTISINVATAGAGVISFTNNSDGSVCRLVNDATYLSWESAKAFNLSFKNLRVDHGYSIPNFIVDPLNSIASLGITSMGTVSGNNYLSTNASGNMDATQVTAAGFIINGFIYSPETPSVFGGVTQGIASASKGLLLNSSKEIMGIAQLSIDYLTLSNNPISCEPFNINNDSNFTSNGQSSLDFPSDNPISCAYNDVLGLYAATSATGSFNNSSVIERHYIMVSKDGVSWHKAYTGQRAAGVKIISVKPGSALGNSFNLGNKYTGFLVFFSGAYPYCKSLFTPDCINFYKTNVTGSVSVLDNNINTSSIFAISELNSFSTCVLINNGAAHPNRILRNDTTGINTTWTSTTTDNNYLWAAEYASGVIWGVANNNVIAHSIGQSSAATTATGETCNAACGAWNSGGSTFRRIIVTASGKVLYGGSATTSTSLTVDATVSFKSCAYNHVLRRFIIGSSNRKIYLSDVDSVTAWTSVTVPTDFNNISWDGCEQALDKGFMLWHGAIATTTIIGSKKICFVDANGNFSSSTTNFNLGLKAGCYGLSNYVVPISRADLGNKIMYSSDGIFWNYTLSTTNLIVDVKWTGTFFVALSSGRDIHRSTDLTNWTTWTNPRSNATGVAIKYIASRNLVVAIFGGGGANGHCVSYSSDGTNWTNSVIPLFDDTTCFDYSPTLDMFVFSPSWSTDLQLSAVVSSDLQTFTPVQSAEKMPNNIPSGICIFWIQNAFYMYSHRSSLWKSTDGLNWEKHPGFVDHNYNQGTSMQTSLFASTRQIVEVPGLGYVTVYGIDADGSCLVSLKNETYRILGIPTGAIKTDSLAYIIYNPDANALLLYKKDTLGMPGETFQIMDLAEYVKSNKEIPIDYIDKMYSDTPAITDSLSSLTTITASLDGGSNSLAILEEAVNVGITTSVTTVQYSKITYGNNTFVAITGSAAYTSNDCITWTTRTTPSSIYGITWCPFVNLFVIVGSNTAATSPDGITWTTRTVPTGTWISVTCSNSLIVAVGTSGTNRVMTSSDGITWTGRTSGDDTSSWICVKWTQSLGLFSALSETGTRRSMYSSNGINWTLGCNNNQFDVDTHTSFSWSEKLKIFVSVARAGSYRLGYSHNGKDWKTIDVTTFGSYPFYSVIWSTLYGCFYAISTSGYAIYSCDGIRWYVVTNSFYALAVNDMVEAVDKKIIAVAATSTSVYTIKPQRKFIYDTIATEGNRKFSDAIWSSSLNMYVSCCDISGVAFMSSSMYSYDGITWNNGKLMGLSPFMLCEGFPGGNSRILVLMRTGNVSQTISYTDNGIDWTGVKLPGTSINPRYVCWGGNQFILVGNSGSNKVMTSPDGITWTSRTSGNESAGWETICWGNPSGSTLYVAFAMNGTGNRLMTSPDGVTWTERASPNNANTWSDVAWSPTLQLYVVGSSTVADTIKIATSPDGINWTTRLFPPLMNSQSAVRRIKWNSDHFIIIMTSGVNGLITSHDGITWYLKTYVQSYSNDFFSGVGNGNKLIQCGNDYTTGTCYTENYLNGVHPAFITDQGVGVVYLGNNVVVATTTTTNFKTMRSTDKGITWTRIASSTTANSWRGITYSPSLDRLVAVSQSGSNRAMYSNDKGLTWSASSTSNETNSWQRVVYGNDLFVAVSATGTNRVMTSSNGTSWTGVSADATAWYDIVYGNNLFVAVGGPNATSIMYSSDGSSWTTASSTISSATWMSVTWSQSASLFVATGTSSGAGKLITSPDGATWTERTLPGSTTAMGGVCAGTNVILAFGADSAVPMLFGSTNGTTWNRYVTSSFTPTTTSQVIYLADSDVFLLATAGSYGIIHYQKFSPNDIRQISAKSFNSNAYMRRITWGNNEFMTCQASSPTFFAVSNNGKEWSKITVYSNPLTLTALAASPISITYGNGLYVSFLTAAPKVLYSSNKYDWTRIASSDDSKVWNEAKYMGGLFISVGVNAIARSSNGINWTTSDTTTGSWNDVIWVQELTLYIVVGDGNKIITSPDGTTWTQRTGPKTGIDWKCIAWSPTLARVSIVGSTGVDSVGWSSDGINWNNGFCNFSNTFNAMVWDATNSIFISAGSSTSVTYSCIISIDGIKWYNRHNIGTTTHRVTMGLAYSPSLGIVVSADQAGASTGSENCIGARIFDLNQPDVVVNTLDTFWDVIWSNSFGRYCAFKKTNTVVTETQQYFSMDGYTWAVDPNSTTYATYNATSRTSNVLGYVEIPSLDAIITCRGTAFVQIISPFKIAEVSIPSIGNCVGISYITSTKTLVIIGSTSYALCATDPTLSQIRSNSNITLPAAVTFSGVVQCNGKYLMVQANASNTYYISSDLTNWTSGTMPSSAIWKFVSESTKRLVAVSNTGVIAYTDNGTSWTTAYTGSQKFVNVRYLVDQRAFVACDYNATSNILVSLDNGANWQSVSLPQTLRVSDICYSSIHDRFVIISGGEIGSSGVSSITVSLPKIPAGGNVLRFHNGTLATNTFQLTAKGGIMTGNRAYNGFTSTTTENQPLLSLDTNSAYKPSSSAWTIFSDERIKKDIVTLDDNRCLEIVKNLPLKYYKWLDQFAEQTSTADKHKLGWIAQDVQELVPTAIRTIGDYTLSDGTVVKDLKTLSSDQLIVCMHGAMRALIKRYEDLESVLNENA